MIAKLKDIIYTRDGKQIVSFVTSSDFSEEFDKLKDAEVDVEIKKHRKKRSLDANSYCWVLCDKIAKRLSDTKVIHTKEDVYKNAIKEVGAFFDSDPLSTEKAEEFRITWEACGVGYLTEQVSQSFDGSKVIIRFYHGSSRYDTKQMSRLIDCLVEDCRALGIPTETPDQIANRLSIWEQEYKKRKDKTK